MVEEFINNEELNSNYEYGFKETTFIYFVKYLSFRMCNKSCEFIMKCMYEDKCCLSYMWEGYVSVKPA